MVVKYKLKVGVKMYYKKIVGERIFLAPIRTEDYKKYTAWVNDMDVAVGLVFASKIITEEGEKQALERLKDNGINLAIIDKETNELIGNCGFPKFDQLNQSAEVGIFIGDKDYWSRGYGTEALKLLCDYGFNVLNLYNIGLVVYSYNVQAYKSYKKVGFKEVGRRRGAKYIAGERYDEIIMDIIAPEFESPYIKGVIEKKMGN